MSLIFAQTTLLVQGHQLLVCSFSPNGTHIAAGATSWDCYVWSWDMFPQQPQPATALHSRSSATPAVDAASLGETAAPQQLAILQGHENDVLLLQFSGDSNALATGSKDGSLRVRHRSSGAPCQLGCIRDACMIQDFRIEVFTLTFSEWFLSPARLVSKHAESAHGCHVLTIVRTTRTSMPEAHLPDCCSRHRCGGGSERRPPETQNFKKETLIPKLITETECFHHRCGGGNKGGVGRLPGSAR